MTWWAEHKFTERKVPGSNPTSNSRPFPSRLGQPGGTPFLVLPPDGMAARHRKGVLELINYQAVCSNQRAFESLVHNSRWLRSSNPTWWLLLRHRFKLAGSQFKKEWKAPSLITPWFPRNWCGFDKQTHLQVDLVSTGDSSESLVYDVIQLNVLHTDHFTFQSKSFQQPCLSNLIVSQPLVLPLGGTAARHRRGARSKMGRRRWGCRDVNCLPDCQLHDPSFPRVRSMLPRMSNYRLWRGLRQNACYLFAELKHPFSVKLPCHLKEARGLGYRQAAWTREVERQRSGSNHGPS
ncbi:hypothetical protein T265_14645, partial [Opisthorchis viverrini]